MATAKEAANLGAKVACLDFVKPSPAGTTWGLGGTCVNVGCIPKKLFHAGAILRQSIRDDSAAFGIEVGNNKDGDQLKDPSTDQHWGSIRESIQNHIGSLNFKYRVSLREKEVTYLNKLAKFTDAHTIEATDKKGKTASLTASRFLIATGGRPSALDCEGGELSISSDDVFAMEKSPGKTLCVGASYISLECGGFLAGLGLDVTIAVRSILLRGFDRECADKIGDYMVEHGVKFKRGVTPTKLEKTESGQIMVTFSDGSSDVYDTVLTAIGRVADTQKLGLESAGVGTSPKTGKVLGKNEQSSCPNIYAVGDVLEGSQELTPVAIQAGIYLARRLFGGMTEPMDYEKVCTTVFTPIEYSTVGISEDDAIERFGLENIEVYHREFLPLEWSLSPSRSHSNGFAKVIVDKTPEENVLGIHYLGPNAGEVMQGYGVAMKQGLTFKQLTETVGIHPTSSEELVTLSTTKSSGKDVSSRNHTLNAVLIYLSSLTLSFSTFVSHLSFSTCRQRLEAAEARSFGGSDWCNNT
jgi:thioredoxin/glutathione reductase (selenoprotein)